MPNRKASIEAAEAEAESFLLSDDVNSSFTEETSTRYKLENSQRITIRRYRAVICFLLMFYLFSAVLVAFRSVRLPSQSLPSQGIFPPSKALYHFRVLFSRNY